MWETKDWKEWTREDCEKVLYESPWGFRQSKTNTYSDNSPVWGEGLGVSKYWHEYQIRSALPIQQALIRLEQIRKNYGRMNAPKRQAFDEQMATQIAPYRRGQIVIRVSDGGSYTPAWPSGLKATDYPFSGEPGASLWIMSQKKFVKAAEIRNFKKDSSHVEFEAFFPRLVDGEVVLGPNDLMIDFRFGYTKDNKPQLVGGYRFQLAELRYQGKLEY